MNKQESASKHHERVSPGWYYYSIRHNLLQRYWYKRRFEGIPEYWMKREEEAENSRSIVLGEENYGKIVIQKRLIKNK